MTVDRRVCEHCHAELSPKWGQGFCPFCGRSILPLTEIEALKAAGAWVKPRQRKLSLKKKPKRKAGTHELPLGRHERTARNPWLWQTQEVEKPPKVPRREMLANLRTAAESSKAPVLFFFSPLMLFLQNVLTLGLRSIYWFRFNEVSLGKLARREAVLPRRLERIWRVTLCAFAACACAILGECILSGWSFSVVRRSPFFVPAVFCFFTSWLVFRYMLFWMRWIILENIFSNLADIKGARSLKPFAPDALLLWFFGSAYMQLHVNRLIWSGVFRPFFRDKTRQNKRAPRTKAS